MHGVGVQETWVTDKQRAPWATVLMGEVDLQGMPGLPEPGAVRPGFQEIRVTDYVKSSAPREQLEKLTKMAEYLSPTRDSLRAVKFTSRIVVQELAAVR